VDADAIGAGDEKSRARLAGFVLDMDMMPAVLAEALQNRARLATRFKSAFQFHFAAGEIVVLDVDDK
jgi:hypothetical protein